MFNPPRIHLFQGYGIELEYMLVDRDTLRVAPLADELLKSQIGTYASDFENGMVTWSNELVLHVIELKSSQPENDLDGLQQAFADNIRHINTVASGWNAMLMPTAAHPFMDPYTETQLWPHENNDVYALYNRIFDCRGHGWSNLQSTHINLPFYDDEEFAKLHAAIRLTLPILPALCASSPLIDGKLTGWADTRLRFYRSNQSKIPSITGKVIPEAVFSKRNYLNTIYEKIKTDIAPYNASGILNPIWVNSRGAIPRFDRGSIEIRVMDAQECPTAEIAIVKTVIETIKALVKGTFIPFEAQTKWRTDDLARLFNALSEKGGDELIDNPGYLGIFGFPGKRAKASELWQHIFEKAKAAAAMLPEQKEALQMLWTKGTLSKRIVKATGSDPSLPKIKEVYRILSDCLATNKMFIP